jgi:hypothetical protein
LPFESFFEAASKADCWGKIIYEPQASNADVITQGDDRLRSLPSFKNHKVFACNALLTDYHGKALLEPHLLLQDLNLIFSGDTLSSDYHYFRPWINYD